MSSVIEKLFGEQPGFDSAKEWLQVVLTLFARPDMNTAIRVSFHDEKDALVSYVIRVVQLSFPLTRSGGAALVQVCFDDYFLGNLLVIRDDEGNVLPNFGFGLDANLTPVNLTLFYKALMNTIYNTYKNS